MFLIIGILTVAGFQLNINAFGFFFECFSKMHEDSKNIETIPKSTDVH